MGKEFWDFELPKEINDPDVSKPDDWDDEDDGDWEAPMIPNPEYQGPWAPQEIDNPDYKGPWEHPKIPNPDFQEVNNPAHRLPINFIGFDLWQVKSGTLFGDVVLADSEEDLAGFLWDEDKFKAEKEAKKAYDKANEPEPEEEEDEDEQADMEELLSEAEKAV